MKAERLKNTITFLILVLSILIILRLYLPSWALYTINQKLSDMGEYSGHIEDIDIDLYRGAYQLQKLSISKIKGTHKVPFIRIDDIDIALSWRALFKGKVLTDISLHSPQVNFVDSEKADNTQSGKGGDWQSVVEGLIPITISKINLHNGIIAFRNFESKPPVNIQLTEINAVISNLTNISGQDGKRVATLTLDAKLLNSAHLEMNAQFDPFVSNDFGIALKTESVSLPLLNDFAQAYAGFDFRGGTGEVVSELKATNGKLNGYVKPLFKKVDILDWQQDAVEDNDGVFQLSWEGLSGGLSALFTNSKTDKAATIIEIDGSLNDPEISTFDAILAALKNAFIEAFDNKFEGLKGKE
ncbi:hypothetical protein C0J08_07730 [Marinomonas sp. CT5]|uniref:DUF748 domain-containing protein n=1 Tax=Marinomonas sp. CT5 TaxID=2066133 RepID=UPI001849C536|nr:DUF748 domain-containing protein [Marinomonas sp. CT5]NVK71841.1 DUF748 domain-containing protein [Oceanospirillaceae bacterium]QUX95315.1 hypothetical protein C0J08_07730 [Marinomonas sp. CT5]